MNGVNERIKFDRKVKYFYQDYKVYSFCKQEMLEYESVLSSIRYYRKKYKGIELNKIINLVIKNHLRIRDKKRIINFIKWMEKTNIYRFKEISEVLNIEFASLNKLYKKGFLERRLLI